MGTESRGRLPTYLLVGGLGLNVVHACSLFFGKEKKNFSTRHAYQWSDGLILDVLPRGPLKLNLDVLPRGPMDLNFGRASQRSDGLKFGRASQRFDGLKFWTCFPEVRWIKFGRASQRSDGLMFPCPMD